MKEEIPEDGDAEIKVAVDEAAKVIDQLKISLDKLVTKNQCK